MPALADAASGYPERRNARAGRVSGAWLDVGQASAAVLADWYRQDDGDDLYDVLLDDEFDPDCSPPDDEETRLASLAASAMARPVGDALAAGFTHRDPGASALGFAAGGQLDLLAPGPVLAGFASDATDSGHGGLTDDELIGLLCAWRRLASWAAAGEVRAVCELASRRQAEARRAKNHHLIDHIGDELAAALTLTGRSADRLLELSAGLRRLDVCLDAMAEGRIDWPRATVLVDELAMLDDADAAQVEAKILPGAGDLTTGQLRAALRRAVLAVDPKAADRRRREASKDARVQTWDETSGNAALAGRDLPPAEAIAADQRLTALAKWLKEQGAEGTVSRLRAAVFVAVLAGRPVRTLLPGWAGSRPDGAPDRSDGLVAGQAASGSWASGAAPVSAGSAGPAPVSAGFGDQAGSAVPGDGPWPDLPLVPPGVAGSVNLTMPMSSWLGLTDVPGEIAGHGPVDAATCRELAGVLAAAPDVRWHLTITGSDGRAVAHACARAGPGPPTGDPAAWLASLTITVLESGACTHQREVMGYRPPRSLRHLIEIRQRTCCYPGCRRPAIRCDHDHTVPYERGGRTCECNISPVCRRHHQAKGLPGWHLRQDEPGTLTWMPPSGRTYTTRPAAYPA